MSTKPDHLAKLLAAARAFIATYWPDETLMTIVLKLNSGKKIELPVPPPPAKEDKDA